MPGRWLPTGDFCLSPLAEELQTSLPSPLRPGSLHPTVRGTPSLRLPVGCSRSVPPQLNPLPSSKPALLSSLAPYPIWFCLTPGPSPESQPQGPLPYVHIRVSHPGWWMEIASRPLSSDGVVRTETNSGCQSSSVFPPQQAGNKMFKE